MNHLNFLTKTTDDELHNIMQYIKHLAEHNFFECIALPILSACNMPVFRFLKVIIPHHITTAVKTIIIINISSLSTNNVIVTLNNIQEKNMYTKTRIFFITFNIFLINLGNS